jgi:hypothetical protein
LASAASCVYSKEDYRPLFALIQLGNVLTQVYPTTITGTEKLNRI